MPLAASQQKMLRQFSLFAGCNSANYSPMIQSLEPYVLPKGKYLTQEPSMGRPLCFLLAGEVEYCTSAGVIFMTCKAPYLFFNELPKEEDSDDYYPRICARSPVAVFTYLPEEDVRNAMKRDSVFTMNLVHLMAEWNHTLHQIACRFSAPSPSARLAMLLQQQSDHQVMDVSSGISNLARTLDVSRATLYRSLTELEDRGVIKRDGKLIRVVNSDELGEIIKAESESDI